MGEEVIRSVVFVVWFGNACALLACCPAQAAVPGKPFAFRCMCYNLLADELVSGCWACRGVQVHLPCARMARRLCSLRSIVSISHYQ
jgi:hypothetical protein